MNKTIMALAGVVIIGGAIAFVATRPKTSPVVPGTADVATTTETKAPTGKKMAFSEFVKQGGSYQCTVNQYIDSTYTSTTQGKVYLSDGKIRGDFSVDVNGQTMKTSLIVNSGFIYTWSSLIPYGIKVPVQDSKTIDPKAEASGKMSWRSDMVGDYDCKPWAMEAGQFTLPANVTFKEL